VWGFGPGPQTVGVAKIDWMRRAVTRSSAPGSRSFPTGFFVLAYALAWLVWVPSLITGGQTSLPTNLGAAAPAAAAVLLTWRAGRRRSAPQGVLSAQRDLWRPLFHWRVAPLWWLVCAAGPLALWGGALALHSVSGGTITGYIDPGHPTMPTNPWEWMFAVAVVFAFVLVLSVIGEELGWRGYALPRLLARWDALTASVILGVLWAAWHAPLFVTSGLVQSRVPVVWFVLQILGQTIILTWVYQRTNGSVLLASVLHASANVGMGVLPVLPLDTGGSTRVLWIVLALEWLVVAGVLGAAGRDLGGASSERPVPISRDRASSMHIDSTGNASQ